MAYLPDDDVESGSKRMVERVSSAGDIMLSLAKPSRIVLRKYTENV